MQQPSPTISGISSPSSFLSPRASPLLGTPAEQIDSFSNINIPVYESQPHQQQQPQQTHQIQPLPDGCDTDHKNIASNGEDAAPPKQVALAMERLAQMGRLIAECRLCADRIVETILKTVHFRNADPNSQKYVPILRSEGELMSKHLEELRSLGRTLESSGVLIGALQKLQETPGWGLHMPLVCPDGAVVAYAWKRQLAGQAAASAVDRTRLALKAFTDQKRRFFPHLEDNTYGKDSSADLHVTKKPCLSFARFQGQLQDPLPKPEEHADLLNVLKTLEAEASNMKIIAYPRFEWLEKASLPHAASWKNTARLSKQEPSSSEDSVSSDMLGVLDILVPCAFRAVVSVTPAGSTSADAVAVFSAEEAGTHIQARGSSVYSAFREISKYADKALQYFLHTPSYSPLEAFLRWLYTYQSLFTKSCSKCGQVLAMHTPLGMLLPPVIRPYRRFEMQKTTLTQPLANMKQQNIEEGLAFHIGCILEDEL